MTGIGKPDNTDKHNKTKCKTCLFFSKNLGWCNYRDLTGRSRIADGGNLLPGGGCKLYRKGRMSDIYYRNAYGTKQVSLIGKPMSKFGRKTEDDFARISELYNKGLSDMQIAKDAGVDKKTVARWRKNNKLESNYNLGRKKQAETLA